MLSHFSCVQFLAGELRSLMQHRTAKTFWGASQLSLVVKNVPASAGDVRDTGPVPGSRRSLEGGHGNPLQYSYLENPMDSEHGRLQSLGSQESQT